MREELKEYCFDWMLYSTMNIGKKLKNSTQNEINTMYRYLPYFKGIIQPILQEGETGHLFLRMISEYLENIIYAHDRGKKRAMSTFCFSPAIFYAMDVVPVTLELLTVLMTVNWRRGTSEYLDYACEIGFTETSCSSQRGSLGAYLAGVGQPIDFIVCDSPGVCDTNANSFAFTSAYLDIPMYQINYPPTLTDERAAKYHTQDFKGLIAFIEKQTENTLKEDKLQEVLEELKIQDEMIMELEEYQRLVPNPFPAIYNLFLYAGRFFFAGHTTFTAILKAMLKKVEQNASQKKSGLSKGDEKIRALFCYIDHYTTHVRFWQWLDNKGISHIGNILSRFWSDNMPYVKGMENSSYSIQTDSLENMIHSIAQANSRMPMVRSIRGPYDRPGMWLEETLSLAKIYKADCIIYNGTPGCRNTWGMVKLLARDTEKMGFPTHIMYADAFDDRVESWEATSDRLDEFFSVRGLY